MIDDRRHESEEDGASGSDDAARARGWPAGRRMLAAMNIPLYAAMIRLRIMAPRALPSGSHSHPAGAGRRDLRPEGGLKNPMLPGRHPAPDARRSFR